MTTIQELAQSYLQWFEKLKREGGQDTYTLKNGHPDELYELVYKAHGDMRPDGWRYTFIQEALCDIAEASNPDEIDVKPDIYTQDRLDWLASKTDRYGYVDEVAKERDLLKEFGLIEVIGLGQVQEKREVLYSILLSLQEMVSKQEDEDRGK